MPPASTPRRCSHIPSPSCRLRSAASHARNDLWSRGSHPPLNRSRRRNAFSFSLSTNTSPNFRRQEFVSQIIVKGLAHPSRHRRRKFPLRPSPDWRPPRLLKNSAPLTNLPRISFPRFPIAAASSLVPPFANTSMPAMSLRRPSSRPLLFPAR